MPLGDVLDLDSILYILELTKSLLSVSCIIDLRCLVKFDGHHVTIGDNSHGSVKFWPKECEKVAFIGYSKI